MTLEIIRYEQTYENEVVNLWNECLSKDNISIKIFRDQVLLDDNFSNEYALIAKENNNVIGFILGVKRQIPYLERGMESEKAWIPIMFVKKEYRRLKIGKKMVQSIENKFVVLDVKKIVLAAYSPNYFFAGIDKKNYPEAIQFFEKLGYYKYGDAVSMHADLWDYAFPDSVKMKMEEAYKAGFQFQKFTYKYCLALIEFVKVNFGGGWKRNVLMAMQNNTAEQVIWIAINRDDEVVGFCMRKMDGFDNRFGPFGVLETLRSHGIGSILFNLMMKDMREQRLYFLYFLWTHGDGMRFYLRNGVKVYREFDMYQKDI